MTKYRADFEVMAASVLGGGIPSITLNTHEPPFEVTFRNAPLDDKGHSPHLIASVIGDCKSLRDAPDAFRQILAYCLDVMAFSTHTSFRINQCVLVMEWEQYQKDRRSLIQKKFDMNDPPDPSMTPECGNTAQLIIDLKPKDYIERALQWFRYAVIGTQPEEQFQYFWLAIEVIAEGSKTSERIPIPCSKCNAPLVCSDCGDTPTRIPMPQQAIREWIDKLYGSNSKEVYRILNAARNHLLHGGSKESLAAKLRVSTDVIINTAGALAWGMIFQSLNFARPPIFFHRGGDFVSKVMVMSGDLTFSLPEQDGYPLEDKMPRINLDMTTSFREGFPELQPLNEPPAA